MMFEGDILPIVPGSVLQKALIVGRPSHQIRSRSGREILRERVAHAGQVRARSIKKPHLRKSAHGRQDIASIKSRCKL
jgi:hypothetical protein